MQETSDTNDENRGNACLCPLFHPKVYGKLSNKFIFVDGTLNSDGKQYFGKMDYVPYSNRYIEQKYKDETIPFEMFDMNRKAKGAARVHGLYADQLGQVSIQDMNNYMECNSVIAMAISVLTADPTVSPGGNIGNWIDYDALGCFRSFATGIGGNAEAWEPGYTRKNIPADRWILKGTKGSNSAKNHLEKNLRKAMKALEGVLNQYNTEVYLSVSPDKKMDGCLYANVNETMGLSTAVSVVCNIAAFGTFNDADAGITLHCVHNPETGEYTMDFRYCLIDYYDFTFSQILNEQDMLGIARGYELYGWLNDTVTWKKGEEKQFYESWIESLGEHVNEKTQ